MRRERLECQREQRVARQDRHGFAEDFVGSELAAAVIVVIERRQIVVDQRIGVDEFQRAGGGLDAGGGIGNGTRAASRHRIGRMRLPPANRL